ncbi:MAG TPA: HEAT repeat domain-containing protein [Planctomycetota bacterium]|nr:HEAT repeat domain-containing protein [Planctomycetota bacterium]
MSRIACSIALAAVLFSIAGCTTTAAKKALNKPQLSDSYTAFDAGASDSNKRKAEKVEPVKEDMDAEIAVTKLVEQLQRQEAAYTLSAEEQLLAWGRKQGVDKIVYNKVRLLLKHPRVEVRAPALRLVKLYGGRDSIPDLIECLGDPEPPIRTEAFKSLQAKTKRDFGYQPNGGEVARWKSVEDWRQWWQAEQRKVAVQPASVYEEKPLAEPKIVTPKN